jgi:hypothetical protein
MLRLYLLIYFEGCLFIYSLVSKSVLMWHKDKTVLSVLWLFVNVFVLKKENRREKEREKSFDKQSLSHSRIPINPQALTISQTILGP